jgi:hypothetical protein
MARPAWARSGIGRTERCTSATTGLLQLFTRNGAPNPGGIPADLPPRHQDPAARSGPAIPRAARPAARFGIARPQAMSEHGKARATLDSPPPSPVTSPPAGEVAAAAVHLAWEGPRDSRVAADQAGPANGMIMTEVSLDELGPVDYVVVEFPAGASNFTGEMAAELRKLVDSGTIRVIDALILTKDTDGAVEATELSDAGELGELQEIEAQLAELLAADDVDNLAAAMEPGSTAGVLIWENLWAAPFASAARRAGGQLIADGRIPIQAIIASIEADEATATTGD